MRRAGDEHRLLLNCGCVWHLSVGNQSDRALVLDPAEAAREFPIAMCRPQRSAGSIRVLVSCLAAVALAACPPGETGNGGSAGNAGTTGGGGMAGSSAPGKGGTTGAAGISGPDDAGPTGAAGTTGSAGIGGAAAPAAARAPPARRAP